MKIKKNNSNTSKIGSGSRYDLFLNVLKKNRIIQAPWKEILPQQDLHAFECRFALFLETVKN